MPKKCLFLGKWFRWWLWLLNSGTSLWHSTNQSVWLTDIIPKLFAHRMDGFNIHYFYQIFSCMLNNSPLHLFNVKITLNSWGTENNLFFLLLLVCFLSKADRILSRRFSWFLLLFIAWVVFFEFFQFCNGRMNCI